jgi:asparagine synthase (glutamine-hydrolysing)
LELYDSSGFEAPALINYFLTAPNQKCMCGICGQYNFGDQSPIQTETIRRMTDSLIHRGPDDEGYFVDGPLGFGFRRLSIIDLEGGHQPMSDRERSVWVVFNGEIYNFPELKRELEAFGHVFQTRCDTEVIVHGFKQWGDGVLNRLNGMFGLAIWDARTRRLLVARDPFGIKLIYYRVSNSQVHFASEIRGVLAGIEEPPEIDPDAMNLFLRYRYTPSPYTVFKGVQKLAPGTMISVEPGSFRVSRWYRYEPVRFLPKKSEAEVRAELTELYGRALKRHLLSDVPVGLLLSGGVDSGLLLALMNQNGDGWPTYTIGYGSSFAADELADGADTARRFGANHTSVQIDQRTFETALPRIVSCLEEPVASSSIIPMYFVSERARQDVKVALTGQGPDELFGGYRRHLGVRYGAAWGSLPRWLRTPISAGISALPRNETLKRGVYALDATPRLKRYQQVLSILPGKQIDGLFRDGVVGPSSGDAILESWADLAGLIDHTDELGGLQYLELRSTLPDELLMYTDKLSMAHGLEVRVPYLDRELVEYVERLPASFKVRNGVRKWIHRRVAESFLPAALLKRKKRGFAVNVVDSWFRSRTGGLMEDVLLDKDSRLYQYLRPEAVRALIDEHHVGRGDHHKILFSLVVFEEWLRLHKEHGYRAQVSPAVSPIMSSISSV